MTQVFPRPLKERIIEGAITFGVIVGLIAIVSGAVFGLAYFLQDAEAKSRCSNALIDFDSISQCRSDGRCTYTARDLRRLDRAREQIKQCGIESLESWQL